MGHRPKIVKKSPASADLIDIACSKQNIKIMCMSEIWHPDNDITEKIKKRWNWIASERKQKGGGGVGIMISKSIKIIERKDLVEDKVEAVWCNVYAKDLSFIIGSVYIPPDDKDAMNNFLRSLQSIMSKIDIPIIVTGDFNASHLLWHTKATIFFGRYCMIFLLQKI